MKFNCNFKWNASSPSFPIVCRSAANVLSCRSAAFALSLAQDVLERRR